MAVSADLYRFIGGLSIDGTGKIIENELDKKSSYVSSHFTPNLQVSGLSVKVIDSIKLDTTQVYSNTTDPDSILYKLQHSALAVTAPGIYRYCQAVMLDCYSIIYSYEDDPILFENLTPGDLDTDINNCLFLSDYFSGNEDTADLASLYNDLMVEFGVIKNFLADLQTMDKETVETYGTV